jgi:uncharacterized OB-fold protein
LSKPVIDTWRPAHSRYLQTDDEAFSLAVGYQALVDQVLQQLIDRAGEVSDRPEVNHVITYAPDGRSYLRLAKSSPLAAAFNQEPLLMNAGDLGSASVLAQLAALLESGRARPGQMIALVGYGDGADAYYFRITEALHHRRPRRTVMDWLNRKDYLPAYNLALYFREGIIDKAPFPVETEPWTSLPLQQREERSLLNFHGVRCQNCGAVWWPIRSNCYECSGVVMADHKLSRRGTVASFVAEWATPSPLPPVGMVIVDNEAGARITTPLCDGSVEALHSGDQVEFTLRLLHRAKGLPHYTWKVRRV